jgi:hypothetical protein
MKRPTYTVAMRDWSPNLGDWIWVATDGTRPPQAALQWRELVETTPGAKRWQAWEDR